MTLPLRLEGQSLRVGWKTAAEPCNLWTHAGVPKPTFSARAEHSTRQEPCSGRAPAPFAVSIAKSGAGAALLPQVQAKVRGLVLRAVTTLAALGASQGPQPGPCRSLELISAAWVSPTSPATAPPPSLPLAASVAYVVAHCRRRCLSCPPVLPVSLATCCSVTMRLACSRSWPTSPLQRMLAMPGMPCTTTTTRQERHSRRLHSQTPPGELPPRCCGVAEGLQQLAGSVAQGPARSLTPLSVGWHRRRPLDLPASPPAPQPPVCVVAQGVSQRRGPPPAWLHRHAGAAAAAHGGARLCAHQVGRGRQPAGAAACWTALRPAAPASPMPPRPGLRTPALPMQRAARPPLLSYRGPRAAGAALHRLAAQRV